MGTWFKAKEFGRLAARPLLIAAAGCALFALGLGVGWRLRGPGPPSPGGPDRPVAPAATLTVARLAREGDSAAKKAAFGEWRRLVNGPTHGLADFGFSLFTLAPGQAPHPPHRHAAEELMLVREGTGVLTLDASESPTGAGDVTYVPPWALHGLRNTGTGPLSYYVMRWNGRGVPPAPRPAHLPPEEKPR